MGVPPGDMDSLYLPASIAARESLPLTATTTTAALLYTLKRLKHTFNRSRPRRTP